MATGRIGIGERFLAALAAPEPDVPGQLLALLHPQANFMALGSNASGAHEVAEMLQHGPNGELGRRLQWLAPSEAGDKVRLAGEARPGTMDRGLVVTLGFDGDAIVLVQQQRTPPPPPPAAPIVLAEPLKKMINEALVQRRPMLVAYSDPQGQPVLTFRGSVQADGDDRLAMWIRSADGAFIQAIRNNARLALMYRNEDSKATYTFQGRAHVTDLDSDRRRIFDASPEAERAHDFAMLGVAVLVDLDRVEGYAGLGPGGQVGQIRMWRKAPSH
jgi:hypothetical protein